MINKLPPIEKIPEAYSAIADQRIEMNEPQNQAYISSSDGAKRYTVGWDGTHYTSNDSATYWAGYPGYPVLAVWMKQGILPMNEEIASLFAGINWNELNKKHKRNYAKALDEVIRERAMDETSVRAELERVYEILKTLDLTVGRGKGRP
ncbi:MAG: hypothetical protein IKD68_04420 [Solobacterium sp.]|nr:hypothetical protein [Solobacterium sp.]